METTPETRPSRLTILRGRALPPDVWRFVRFGLVGGSGVLINMLVLKLLYAEIGLPLQLSSVIATSLAIVNNFLWNNFWTFGSSGVSKRRLAQFVLVSLGGMLITLTVLTSLVYIGFHYAPANLIGIGIATTWNFVANARWTWGDVGERLDG